MIETDRNPRRSRATARSLRAIAGDGQIGDATEAPLSEYRELRTTIQELRRKTTIMAAELFELDEVRASRDEASLQLEEARSTILASNSRRKEMARVIANRNAKIEALNRASELRNTEQKNVLAEFRSREKQLEARCEALEGQLQEAKSKHAASQARRKEMALLIGKRDATIMDLQSRLESAHEQVATLERYVRSSVTWWLKKIKR